MTGDTVNNMIALTTEPNARIHEAKTFTAGLRKGRARKAVESNPVSGDDMVVNRGGEAGELAHKLHLGVVDVMKHVNSSADGDGK